MTVRKQQVLIVAMLLLALTVMPNASANNADVKLECERAAEWVKANSAQLPNTLATISTFPIAYRRAIVDTLPPEAQAQLWREHTETLARRPTISVTQRQETLEIAQSIKPVLYDRRNESQVAEGDALRAVLTAKIAAAYPDQDERVLFSVMGPIDNTPTFGEGTEFAAIAEDARVIEAAGAGKQINCNCSSWFSCNANAIRCQFGGCTVIYQCGSLGGAGCYGRCIYP